MVGRRTYLRSRQWTFDDGQTDEAVVESRRAETVKRWSRRGEASRVGVGGEQSQRTEQAEMTTE